MFPRPHAATLWKRSGSDDFGMPSFSEPKHIYVRWETRSDLITDSQGNTVLSSARAYLEWGTSVAVGDFISLGHLSGTDPASVDSAYEIRNVRSIKALIGNFGELRVTV